jgi:hypothetical protein
MRDAGGAGERNIHVCVNREMRSKGMVSIYERQREVITVPIIEVKLCRIHLRPAMLQQKNRA